jgi:hypothetical protein
MVKRRRVATGGFAFASQAKVTGVGVTAPAPAPPLPGPPLFPPARRATDARAADVPRTRRSGRRRGAASGPASATAATVADLTDAPGHREE